MPVANEGLIGLAWDALLKNIMILVVTGILDRRDNPTYMTFDELIHDGIPISWFHFNPWLSGQFIMNP